MQSDIGTTTTTPSGSPPLLLGQHKVVLQKDSVLEMPELWLSVYLTGSPFEKKQFAEMFSRARCFNAKTPEEADLVVFAGGADVDPALYGEMPHSTTVHDEERDIQDIRLFNICKALGIPMFGVCRGAQFLAVMNGSKLFQDVDGHNQSHGMFDRKNKRYISTVSSVHHQMVIPGPGMEVIAHGHQSKNRWYNDHTKATGGHQDVEAYFIRDTCCLGVQGHPEYRGYGEYTKWCLGLIYDYVELNSDLELSGKNRRLKAEYITERFMKEQDGKVEVH